MIQQLDFEGIRGLFVRHGIRCTRQREEIYDLLQRSCEHPTAEEIFGGVRSSQPGISLATVYNTLEVFTRRGLCRKLQVGQGAQPGMGACRYDADLSEHLHLISADGRVSDIPAELGNEIMRQLPPDLLAKIERAMGVRVSRVNVDFVAAPETAGESE